MITRPAVSADEDLGYLPRDAQGKLKFYMQPILDALERSFSGDPSQSDLRGRDTSGLAELVKRIDAQPEGLKYLRLVRLECGRCPARGSTVAELLTLFED